MIRQILLWASLALSTALSAGFFFSLGDTWLSGVFLAALGTVFEGLKSYSWKRTGGGAKRYLWLGIPCTVLSLVASVGYASLTLERGWSEADFKQAKTVKNQQDIAAMDREETALVDAIQKLPPGWTSSAMKLSGRLDVVRNAKRALEPTIQVESSRSSTASLAVSLGRRFGLDGTWVVTLILFAIATLLEVGIVVLALEGDMRKPIEERRGAQVDSDLEPEKEVDRFLNEAVRPDGVLLGRRRLVELGWSERQVRDHVTALIQSGVLEHNGRGSPIRLASLNSQRS